MGTAVATVNRARQIRKDQSLLAYTPSRSALVEAELNDREMSAPFIISTMDEDRESDVIHPDGILEYLHEYKSNPIVLFDHEQHKVVGSSEGPDRQLYLAVRPTEIWAKCFFHDCLWENIPIGQETYHLVRKRIFRGASIGFLPIKTKKRGYGKDSGTEYEKIRLTEWSICPLQSNQNALSEFQDELRACLDRGEIVCKSFGSALRAKYLDAPPVWSPGASFPAMVIKAAKRSPRGGVNIAGKFYRGGMFIPSQVLEHATAAEKAKVNGGKAPKVEKPLVTKPTDEEIHDILDRDTWIEEQAKPAAQAERVNQIMQVSGGGNFTTTADKIIETLNSHPTGRDILASKPPVDGEHDGFFRSLDAAGRIFANGYDRLEGRYGPVAAKGIAAAALVGSVAGGTIVGGSMTAALAGIFISSPYIMIWPDTIEVAGNVIGHSTMGGAYIGGALAAAPFVALAQTYQKIKKTIVGKSLPESPMSAEDVAALGVRFANDCEREWLDKLVGITTRKGKSMASMVTKGGHQAPRGGVIVGGQFYRGGQFIPGTVLAKATSAEKAKVFGNAGTTGENMHVPPQDADVVDFDLEPGDDGIVDFDLDDGPQAADVVSGMGRTHRGNVADTDLKAKERDEAFNRMNESWPGTPEYEAAKLQHINAGLPWEPLEEGPWDTEEEAKNYGHAEVGAEWRTYQRRDGQYGIQTRYNDSNDPDLPKGKKTMSKTRKSAITCHKATFGTREQCRKSLAARGFVPVGEPIDNGDAWTFPIVPDFDGSFDSVKAITKGMAALLVTKKGKMPPKIAEEEDDEADDSVPDESAAASGEADDAADDDADDEGADDDSALEGDAAADTDTEGTEGDVNAAAGDESAEDGAAEGEAADYMNKPGAHTLAEHLAHHEAMVNAHDDRMGRNESPEVHKLLEKSKAVAEQLMTEIHELAKKLYPGIDLNDMAEAYRPEAAGAMDGDPEAEGTEGEGTGADDADLETDDDGIPNTTGAADETGGDQTDADNPLKKKKSLKTKKLNPGHIKAAADFLTDMNGHPKVHKSLHGTCAMHAKCLGDMVKKDMEDESEEGGGQDDDMVEKTLNLMQQTESDVTALNAKLARMGG